MIRVVRVLEYEFKDNETAEKHLGMFQIPLNGMKEFGDPGNPTMVIRSSGIINMNPQVEDE